MHVPGTWYFYFYQVLATGVLRSTKYKVLGTWRPLNELPTSESDRTPKLRFRNSGDKFGFLVLFFTMKKVFVFTEIWRNGVNALQSQQFTKREIGAFCRA